MAGFLFSDSGSLCRKFGRFILALFWIIGLVFGVWSFRFSGAASISLARRAVSSSVSAVGLYLCLLLPLLFSAYAVYSSSPWLIFVLAFCKGCAYSWVAAMVSAAFGSSGWLVRFFFLFSDSIFLVFLYGFWAVYVTGERKLSGRVCAMLAIAGAVISGVDCWMIVPFLRDIVL
jgi:hypothetical protein